MTLPPTNIQMKGDTVLVRHLSKSIKSSTIIIPDTVRTRPELVEAEVIAFGNVPMQRRKNPKHKDKKYFVCDDLKVGDTVLVPEHLGTRGAFPTYPSFIIYDGEDVTAIVK